MSTGPGIYEVDQEVRSKCQRRWRRGIGGEALAKGCCGQRTKRGGGRAAGGFVEVTSAWCAGIVVCVDAAWVEQVTWS